MKTDSASSKSKTPRHRSPNGMSPIGRISIALTDEERMNLLALAEIEGRSASATARVLLLRSMAADNRINQSAGDKA